jgi:hypothetical protein
MGGTSSSVTILRFICAIHARSAAYGSIGNVGARGCGPPARIDQGPDAALGVGGEMKHPERLMQDKTGMDRILFAVFTNENKSQGVSTPFLPTQNN